MKIYPNDLCPCGSGKKYKKCCKNIITTNFTKETLSNIGKLNKDDNKVPFINEPTVDSDDVLQEFRTPIVEFSNDEIYSLRTYDFDKMLDKVGNGDIQKELEITESCINKIENIYHVKLIGERANLKKAETDTRSFSLIECAKFFNTWRKGIVDRYTGKICTGELINFYHGMTNCLKNLPIIVLPDTQKLTTFYEDIFKEFPVKQNMKYTIPFNDYSIKVSDKEGQQLYIAVHKKDTYYELVGLTATSNDDSKSNMDFVMFYPNGEMQLQYKNKFLSMGTTKNADYYAPCIKVPFNYLDCVVKSPVTNEAISSYQWWGDMAIEYAIGADESILADLKIPCSDILILHIWLHTLALYNLMLNIQNVEYIKRNEKTKRDIGSTIVKSISNKCIVDLGKTKRVYVYDTEDEKNTICRKYHILSTIRRGHFRHYSNGKLVYIPPTTVTFSKDNLAEDAHEKEFNTYYRNSEDFLREKSYLEDDVCKMLKSHNINYKREVSSATFSWIGRKRLDFYLPDKKIAIECQGVQHFYPYGSNDSDFDKRKQRDVDKYNECESNGITLLYYVSPNIPIPKEMQKKYLYITDLPDLYCLIS